MNRAFRISVLLNTALLAVAALALSKPRPLAPPVSHQTQVIPTDKVSPPAQPQPDLAPLPMVVTNAFRWERLESTNYAEFVANLRAVGCPERTIRDLVFADAERRYGDLESDEPEAPPFWSAGRARVEANRRAATQRLEAQAELRAELRQLFGMDWHPEEDEMHDVRFQGISRLVVGPVADEAYERACRWLMATIELSQNFRRQRDNLLLASDQAEWDRLVAAQEARLEQIVTPAAFAELQARTCLLEEMLDAKMLHLDDLELTPAELRRVCLVKNREVGWLVSLFHQDRDRSDEAEAAQKVALTAALKRELSPEHFEELVRVQDEKYRDILSATRDNNLPRSAAQQIYAVRQVAQAEAERLRAASQDEAATQALAALQVTTMDSVRKIMGAAPFDKFTARAQWVTNFSKL